MMSKLQTSSTKAIFLASILIAGIFAIASPSFIVGANATEDRDRHDDYKKEKRHDDYKKEKRYDDYDKEKSYDDKYSSYDDTYSSYGDYDDYSSYKDPSKYEYGSDYNNHEDKYKKDFKFYVVKDDMPPKSTPTTPTPITSTAECEYGDEVTGGGFELGFAPGATGTTPHISKITKSIPFENRGNEGWQASADISTGTGVTTLTAYAVCFDEKSKPNNYDNNYDGMSMSSLINSPF